MKKSSGAVWPMPGGVLIPLHQCHSLSRSLSVSLNQAQGNYAANNQFCWFLVRRTSLSNVIEMKSAHRSVVKKVDAVCGGGWAVIKKAGG